MNIKKTIVTLLLGAITTFSYAQGGEENSPCDNKYGVDSVETIKNLSMFNQYYQAKEYVKAFPYWYYLYNNAPCLKKRITFSGPYLIKKAIQDDMYKDRKDGLIDTVFLVYQTRIDFWGSEGAVKGEWANDLGKLRPARRDEAIALFFESMAMEGDKSTYKVPKNFVYAGIKQHKKGMLSLDSLLLIYDVVAPVIENNVAAGGKYLAKWEKTQGNVTKMMLPYLDCDKITALKQPQYKENMENVAFIKSTLNLLEKGDCEKSDFYFELSEQLYSLSPNASAALALAKASKGKEMYVKALDYYKKAASGLEGETLYSTYIQIASLSIHRKKYSEGRTFARKALEINPHSGDAYILIGDAYAASVNACSGSKIKGREVYWVAVDKYAKAKSVDPSVEEKAIKRINKYSAYFPGKQDAFFAGLTDGQSYTVGCWIGEATTVRTIAD